MEGERSSEPLEGRADEPGRDTDIGRFRRLFREAVDAAEPWQTEAQEDYNFVAGKQWTRGEIEDFEKQKRPAITINRIKPLINILSGYQRLNRYDIDFLPRTGDDIEVCEVRKGMTKYILDRCDYDSQESQAFLDAAIGGIGWLDVGYEFDEDAMDGEAYVRREDPFGVYVDPEAHKTDFSDAKHIFRAKWVDKDELAAVYPEHKDEIEAQYAVYDKIETQEGRKADPLWYRRDLGKVRMVECWYKARRPVTMYRMSDGSAIPQQDMRADYFMQGMVESWQTVSRLQVRCCVFVDTILLEDVESPYRHGDFPLVPIICYSFGTGDIPAGIVRDLKDPQREINRRRIQELHILNNSGDGGGFAEEDAMSEEQWHSFEENGATPGYFQKVKPGALGMGKILQKQMTSPPAAVIQAEAQATQDLTAISGINEGLMGTNIPSASSGRAIELKQKQAITHIAPMFDQLRKAKKKVAFLLWGRRGKPGVVPQFYTEDKVYRIEGANGQQFVHVNQQVVQQDPMGYAIVSTLNDLSQGEFDIVVSDTQASTTQRQAQMWSLVDAVSKLSVPGDLVFDIILDLSDLPNKEDIKQRWRERQQAQQQQAQAQMELERIKNENLHQSISFKDAPLPIQLAMAAKQGLIDPQVAEYGINLMVQNMFPQLAQAMAQQRQVQALMQQGQQGQPQGEMPQGALPPAQGNPGGGHGSNMTQAAAQSIMAGAAPAL